MGGLLARAALQHCSAGTARAHHAPDRHRAPRTAASLGAVQALRATYPVRAAAGGDRPRARRRSSSTRRRFRSFPSLYQMLPAPSGALDLFDARPLASRAAAAGRARCWRPRARFAGSWLRRGRALRLASSAPASAPSPASSACADAVSLRGQRRRRRHRAGRLRDAARARATIRLRCEHSELPRSARVAAALIELLRHGRTARLRGGRARAPAAAAVYVTDADAAAGVRAQARLAAPGRRRATPLSESAERAAGALSARADRCALRRTPRRTG